MLVKIAAVEREFRNTHPGIKSMFAWIDESMKELQAEFSHLVVDGVEVVDAPREYVKKKLKDIRLVEVGYRIKKPAHRHKKTVKTASSVQTDVLHVRISNLDFTVAKTPAGIDEMSTRINEVMKEFQVFFSHLVVDGHELKAEDPLEYLKENLGGVQEIEVCFLTLEQYFQHVMQIMDDFLSKAAPSLEGLADEFYGKPDDETWAHLETHMNGINSLLGVIGNMITIPELAGKTETFATLGDSIGLHLENLKNAAQLSDYTLIADILRFELLEFLKQLLTAVQKLVGRHTDVAH